MHNKFIIQENMDQLEKLGLLKEELDVEEFEDALEQNTEELKKLLRKVNHEDYIQEMTFDDLIKLPFNEARNVIDRMDMAKRIFMLDELTTLRNFYYSKEALTQDGRELSEVEVRALIGKIKHLEILQNWLYGIA